MRKFHFDFAPVVDKNDRKPVYHLQYGGKPTPRMKELNVDDEHILPWLSSPRINSTPINLALLLDMIFRPFRCDPIDLFASYISISSLSRLTSRSYPLNFAYLSK